MKEKYIELVGKFLDDLKNKVNPEANNEALKEMERSHKQELMKIFKVPDNQYLYGFVKDKYFK